MGGGLLQRLSLQQRLGWELAFRREAFVFDVERSVDGGTTYSAVRNSPVTATSSQIAEIDDYEAPFDSTIRYRAKARADI